MVKLKRIPRMMATALILIWGHVSIGFAETNSSIYESELEDLFSRLAVAENLDDSQDIIMKIWQFWTTDTEDSINIQMMRRGIGYMEQGDLINAEAMFTRIIGRDDNFTEAWNKRATIRYIMGNLDGSENDIAEVLKREPRHFGALAGLGMINIQRGDLNTALDIYQQILVIHPFNPDANSIIPELKLKLRGDPA